MTKHLVFLHQNYPAQFGPISQFLLENYDVKISFISEYIAKPVTQGINHYLYEPAKTGHEENPYFFSKWFEQEAASMQGIYNSLETQGIKDIDLFVGHAGFGTMGLLHVAYPDIPKIGFFEYFYDATETITDQRPEFPAQLANRMRVPLRNATQLLELEYCTKGYSPTNFQKSTYPTRYQDKLQTLFDGIDTDFYSPGEVANNSPLWQYLKPIPVGNKVITFVSRGLEAMRGFDIFMEAAYQICQQRNDVTFVIAGRPKTHYGSELNHIKEASFKEHVLKQRDYELSRFRFLNWIPEEALVDLFRLSDCHFYWTVPFTLSWSFFQALSTGVNMLASDTLPVRGVLRDGINGTFCNPYDVKDITHKMLAIISSPSKDSKLNEQARHEIVEHYDVNVCLPKLAAYYLG